MMRNLVQMRHKHNLKQSVVAERMGVTQLSVSQFERYDANPTLDTVRRYAMAVGARVSTRVIDDLAGYLPNTGSANQVSITRTKSILTTSKFVSSVICCNIGAIARHGGHHGAQKSTKTGRLLFSTFSSNSCLVVILINAIIPPSIFTLLTYSSND